MSQRLSSRKVSWGEALRRRADAEDHLERGLFHDHRRHPRHHDLALSVLLAGLAGSRRPARRCHEAAADRKAFWRAEGIPSHPRRYHGRHGVFQSDRALDHHHGRSDAARRGQDRYRELGAGRRSAEADRGRVGRSRFLRSASSAPGCSRSRCSPAPPPTRSAKDGSGRSDSRASRRKPPRSTPCWRCRRRSASRSTSRSINPISALYWSAVINGVLAVPVMVLLMLMARRRDVMGRFVIGGPLYWLGWLSTAAMALSVLAMGVGFF